MSPIKECIKKKKVNINPIWIMRQAGRYLPEFRKIRKKNPDFIKLCLNKNIVPEITLQPLRRFDFDAAIIFSDILMLPYGLGQNVNFTKGFGPSLSKTSIKLMKSVTREEFLKKINPVYKSLKIVSKNKILKNKDLIGFVGAPWTILVYMQNRQSPKKTKLIINQSFKKTFTQIEEIKAIKIIIKFLKLHIKKQVDNGASVIQIFDSWAEILRTEKDREGLVEGLKSEIIDIIATDHAPHRPETKNISFKDANRGVVGLESAFPLIYSSKIFELEEILRFMVVNPTKILQELGYKTLDTFNTWKKSKSIFNTRSFYKNSLFENENIDIERVLSNV